MRVINHKVIKPGSTDHNIITQCEVNQITKTRFEITLFNKAKEDPYRCIVLVEAREKYLQDNLADAPDKTEKHIARLTIDLLNKRSDFDISGVI